MVGRSIPLSPQIFLLYLHFPAQKDHLVPSSTPFQRLLSNNAYIPQLREDLARHQ